MRISASGFLGLTALSLTSCGLTGDAFSPYYYPSHQRASNSYGYTQIQPTRSIAHRDSNRATGIVSLEGGLGAEFITDGQLIRSSDGLAELSMRKAYANGTRFDFSATYPRPSQGRYFTGTAYRSTFNGRDVSLPAIARPPLTGRLSDYSMHGIEFGVRQYSARAAHVFHPFIEARLGGAYVDDISVENRAGRTRLYESGWVPTASAMVGFEAPAFEPLTVGLETGVRVQGRLKADDSPRARQLNVRSTSGSAVTIPFVLRGRYRF